MERNKIIELAQKNGATIWAGKSPGTIIYEGTGGITFEVLERTVKEAVAAELNTCVMICDDIARNGKGGAPTCVRALRERSNMI